MLHNTYIHLIKDLFNSAVSTDTTEGIPQLLSELLPLAFSRWKPDINLALGTTNAEKFFQTLEIN